MRDRRRSAVVRHRQRSGFGLKDAQRSAFAVLAALTLALPLAACSADSGPQIEASTATSAGPSATLSMEDAPPSELTRATIQSSSVLSRGGITASSTLERRAIELFTELDAEQRGDSAVIDLPDTVLFDFDEHELKPESEAVLARLVELAELTAGAPIAIVGHTDGRGSAERNQDLSERRAQAVADALQAAGVEPARVSAEGVGSTQPVAEEGGADDDAARAKNRRVQVSFEGVDFQP